MPTWMVVEDEPDIYDVLLAMFEIWGIDGKAFVDGADACSWVDDVDAGRIRGELPELAILDIRVPEVSGPEIAARLRKSPVLGNIAIVLVTAYHMPPAKETEVMQLSQADLLLYKPLPAMPELREAMDKVIARHRGVRNKPAASPNAKTSKQSPSRATSPETRSPGTTSPGTESANTRDTHTAGNNHQRPNTNQHTNQQPSDKPSRKSSE